jgi:flagellar motor switch protein FliN/FliY
MATMMQTHPQTGAENSTALATLSQPVAPMTENSAIFPETHPAWEMLAGLPIKLEATVPLRGFRVRDLLDLESKRVLESDWAGSADVPLCCDGVQLCWTEFETVEDKIAVRITLLG